MNWNPRNWFWTQWLVVIFFVIFYITISLNPWYYLEVQIQEGQTLEDTLSLKQIIILSRYNIEGNNTIILANNGELSSIDVIFIFCVMFTFLYVFGLFTSKEGNYWKCLTPIIIGFILKGIECYFKTKVFQLRLNSVFVWIISIFLYVLVYLLHNKVVVTEIIELTETEGEGGVQNG